MPRSQCTSREVLAEGGAVSVERCACGSVHLSIGATTLHLSDDGLRLASSILADATDVLDRREQVINEIMGLRGPGPNTGAAS